MFRVDMMVGEKKVRILSVFSVSFLLASFPAMADSLMFQADLERTGIYLDVGPEENPTLAWSFDAKSPVVSTPLVHEGVVYFVDFDGGIYALREGDGTLVWEKNLDGQTSFEIAIDGEKLLVGRRFSRDDDESYLVALDKKTGEEIWRFSPDDPSGMDSPTVYENNIFLVSMSSYLFSLDGETGEDIWRFSIAGGRGSPLVSNDVLYYQDASQTISALCQESGKELWSYAPESDGGRYSSTPAIGDCCIYGLIFSDEEGALVGINKETGKKESEFSVAYRSSSSVSLADSIVFFGDDGEGHAGAHGYMNAIDVDGGEVIWQFETGGFVRGAASIAGDTVYFGSHDHFLYAVDRHTGDKKWRYETGAGIASAPAVVDGRVYFGSIDGHVYVLE